MLTRFELIDCKLAATFMNKQSESASNDHKASKKDILLYQSMIDFLMYVMMKTRLDIAFAINRLSQFNINFTSQHLKAAKHVFRYLKETLNLSITYDDDDRFIEYTNVDWADDLQSRRSIDEYLFKLYDEAVSWSSKRQSTVTLFSCEVEYMKQTQTSKKAV